MSRALTAAAFALLYVLLDWVSFIYPATSAGLTPWNPQSGLAVAYLLYAGLRGWPAIALAALAAEWLVRGWPLGTWASLALAAILAGGLAAIAAAMPRELRRAGAVGSLGGLTRFVAISAAGTFFLSLAYVGVHLWAGAVGRDAYALSVVHLWVGDLIGLVVTLPLALLALEYLPRRSWRAAARAPLAAAQGALVLAAFWIVFGVGQADAAKYFYLLFIPLIWIAVSWGFAGTVVAVAFIQVSLIVSVVALRHAASSVLELQFLMLTLAVTGLFLGMATTELRAQQAGLRRSLRLAAAGEMASALAHELNQPLSAIGSYLRSCAILLRDPAANRERIDETIGKVQREAERAADVVRRLRDFFRAGMTSLEAVDLAQLVGDAGLQLGARLKRHRVTLSLSAAEGLPRVLVDRVQVGVVVRNLLANAVDAIGADGAEGGRIEVRIEAPDAAMLLVTVTDSGAGVPREAREALFDLFHSTKSEGMGLGLAISRAIIEAHGGELWAESRARSGIFRFTLPAASGEAAQP
jgi:signal transduction histidine kinase